MPSLPSGNTKYHLQRAPQLEGSKYKTSPSTPPGSPIGGEPFFSSTDTWGPSGLQRPSRACPPSSGEVACTRTLTHPRVLFHLLLQQLTLLAVASWLTESQASSCGLHPPNSLQGCVYTQASLRAQIAASSGTRLTFANLKLQGP